MNLFLLIDLKLDVDTVRAVKEVSFTLKGSSFITETENVKKADRNLKIRKVYVTISSTSKIIEKACRNGIN